MFPSVNMCKVGQSSDNRQFVLSCGFLLLTYLSEPQICECTSIYRLIQEERSIFWELIISVMLRKNCVMNL